MNNPVYNCGCDVCCENCLNAGSPPEWVTERYPGIHYACIVYRGIAQRRDKDSRAVSIVSPYQFCDAFHPKCQVGLVTRNKTANIEVELADGTDDLRKILHHIVVHGYKIITVTQFSYLYTVAYQIPSGC